MVQEIVIVGGGIGGVRVAKLLSKWSAGGVHNIHITVIDKSHYHTYYPNLYEVATAHLPEVFGHMPINFFDLKSSAIYPLEDVFADDLNVEVMEDEVLDVDFKKHKIKLKKGKQHHYDILVLGVGSETNYFNIPGLYERALPLKTFFDALEVRNTIDEIFYNTPKNQLIKIVIGGGGFTGCELAGELIGYIKKLSKMHGHPEYYVECLIVEASGGLLGGAGPWVAKRAQKRLGSLGVKFKFKSAIKDVEDGEIVLEDKSKIPYDALIWTAGVKASDLSKQLLGVKLQKGTCVTVDKTLRVSPYENIFGVGDATYCVDEATGKLLPMTASVAIREAKCVAENIKRLISKKPLVNYKSHNAGFVVPLGGKYAIMDASGIRLAGFLPWFLKQLVALHYWSTVAGWWKSLSLWKRGLEVYTEND